MPDIVRIVLQFAVATLLPVAASVGIVALEDRTRLGSMGYWQKQVLLGVVFGAIAVFGTEFGIDTEDATMNVRDAAPLVAGLYFGGPAGIIAGLIGGIERWFSVLWGRGMYTRLACSVATVLVGFYAAGLRRYLFDGRRPSWLMAFFVGITAEVLHLLLIFTTNIGDAAHAYVVVRACSLPMISCNGISVALAGLAIARSSGQRARTFTDVPEISQMVQAGMLVVVAVGFVATVGFMALIQQSLTKSSTYDTLMRDIQDVEDSIQAASDAHLLELTRRAARTIPSVDVASDDLCAELTEELDVNEVHVIDARGFIVYSSDASYLNFDMSSGEQSAEFLALLPGGRSSYIVQPYGPQTINADLWRKFGGVSIDGGFVQVSYDGSRFVDDLTEQVVSSVANRHVGREGMFVVYDEDGAFVGSRVGITVTSPQAARLAQETQNLGADEVGQASFEGVRYYAMARDVEGFTIVALMPTAEADIARDLSVLVISFMEVIVFAALFAAIYLLIKYVVVRSIWQVNGTLSEITSGDLNVEVNVRGSSEFASLSDDINRTVSALRESIAAESARIERDLRTAKEIQSSALPRTFPPFPDIDAFDIYASMNAAREVGGDFYDFFLVDDHRLGFLIADVSGKGIPASLFMMAAKAELANYMGSGMELAEAVKTANWHLCQGNDAGMFVTVWAAVLDWKTGELTYVNAGHNPPLFRRGSGGSWEWLRKKCGLFLGTFETAKYRQETITLEPGDQILLYTDGVNEAFSADEQEYGNDRLEDFLAAHASLHPRELTEALLADVRLWAKGAEQSDDITMVCLEYGVPPEVASSYDVCADAMGLDEALSRIDDELGRRACPLDAQKRVDAALEQLFGCLAQGERVRVSYAYHARPDALTVSLEFAGESVDAFALGLDVDDVSAVSDEDGNVVAFRVSW